MAPGGGDREQREAAVREREVAAREEAATRLPHWPALLPYAIGLEPSLPVLNRPD